MRKCLIFLAALFIANLVRGQSLMCDTVTSYPEISFANYFAAQPDLFFQGDTVLLFKQMEVKVFVPGKAPQTYDLSKLLSKSQKSKLLSAYKYSYFFAQNQLVLRNRNTVFIFSFHKNNFRLETQVVLKQKYGKHIYLDNGILYFYGIYDHLKIDDELAAGYSTYNLKTQDETVFTFPFTPIAMTHLGPNKFMDFTKNGYVVCDPLRYRVYTYTYANTLKDSLSLPGQQFKPSDPARFAKRFNSEKMGTQVVNYLDSMRSYLDTLDRIWLVNYIDENTLFIRLTRNSQLAPGKKGQLFYDHVWIKKIDGWHLAQVKDISNFKMDEAINKEALWPYFFPGSKYTSSNGLLYYSCWSPSPDTFPQTIRHFSGMEAGDRNALHLNVLRFKIKQ